MRGLCNIRDSLPLPLGRVGVGLAPARDLPQIQRFNGVFMTRNLSESR